MCKQSVYKPSESPNSCLTGVLSLIHEGTPSDSEETASGPQDRLVRTGPGGDMTTSGRGFVAMNMLPYGGGDGNEGHCSTPVHARKMLQSGWQSRTRGLSLLAPRLAVAALVVLSMSAVYFNGAMALTGRHPPGAKQDDTYSPAAIQEPSPRLQQRFNWPGMKQKGMLDKIDWSSTCRKSIRLTMLVSLHVQSGRT